MTLRLTARVATVMARNPRLSIQEAYEQAQAAILAEEVNWKWEPISDEARWDAKVIRLVEQFKQIMVPQTYNASRAWQRNAAMLFFSLVDGKDEPEQERGDAEAYRLADVLISAEASYHSPKRGDGFELLFGASPSEIEALAREASRIGDRIDKLTERLAGKNISHPQGHTVTGIREWADWINALVGAFHDVIPRYQAQHREAMQHLYARVKRARGTDDYRGIADMRNVACVSLGYTTRKNVDNRTKDKYHSAASLKVAANRSRNKAA